MKLLVLTANLGDFDKTLLPVPQVDLKGVDLSFQDVTDKQFPPITGLSPRLQYRIPKLFGWQMFPGYDTYLWYDGSMSLQHTKSIEWFIEQLGDADAAFFKHPWRNSIYEEVQHIEEKLRERNDYIVSRYENGLHKEMLDQIYQEDKSYRDHWLFASNVFIYRNTANVRRTLADWWYYQSRYYTCDQVHLPYVLYKNSLDINIINENVFKSQYVSLVSKHR